MESKQSPPNKIDKVKAEAVDFTADMDFIQANQDCLKRLVADFDGAMRFNSGFNPFSKICAIM